MQSYDNGTLVYVINHCFKNILWMDAHINCISINSRCCEIKGIFWLLFTYIFLIPI